MELCCNQVSRSFGKKQVLKDFSLTLKTGHTYGLLGRNKAGKTTLLNLMTSRLLPDSGEITLDGAPIYENIDALKKICYMADQITGFQNLTIGEIFGMAKRTYPNWDEEKKEKLVTRFDLPSSGKYRTLSKGTKTLIGIVIGLASGCPFVFFDEIYSGLDTINRKQFYELLLKEQAEQDRAFLLSSHLIEEMDYLFTDILILKNGALLLEQTQEEVQEKALLLSGRKDRILPLLDKYQISILAEQPMGGLTQFTLYATLTSKQQEAFAAAGASLSPASLSDLFVALLQEGDA